MKSHLKLLKNITCIILIMSTFQTYAQSPTKPTITHVNFNLTNFQVDMSRNAVSLPADVKGSPYITENFVPVKLSINENTVYNGRFNAFNGDMEIKSQDKTIVLDTSKDIEVLFVITNKLYKTCTYNQKNSKTKRGFLVVLTESDSLQLFKLEKINFAEKKPVTSSYDTPKPAEFRKVSDSYFIKIDGQIVFLSTKKKAFLKSFPEYKTKLKNYLKMEKLNLKNESDLIKIVSYLNKLRKE